MLHRNFKSAKCKTALNLAKARVKIMKNKKDVQMRQLRREIAQLLQNGQDQTARIRVEHVIREQNTLAAYEMVEIYCELIVARLPIIESQKNCPLDLKEAISSLIFAAPRCGDITELQDVRKHFTAKYGKDFATAAVELRPACGVSRTLVEKLSVNAPDGPTKIKNLKGIAEEHNIQWEPNWFKDEDTVSSSDPPRKQYTENNSKIQMEPLNVQIADDPEEKHSHGSEKKEKTSQRHPHNNVNVIPPSPISHPNIRPSENEEMLFSQSSGTAENVISADRQQWNMEFKDATAAAQAAAESAERASMAARAAAELSIRDSYKHVQENPTKSPYNHTSPSMKAHQGSTNQQGGISEGHDGRRSNNEYSQSEVQYDTRQHEFRGSESTSLHGKADSPKQSRDSIFSPSTSKADYNRSDSSIIREYETEHAENPFYGQTVEPQSQPSNFDSHSSDFGDEYGAFSNLEHQKDDIHPDRRFGAFSQEIFEEENWDAKTRYVAKLNSIKDESAVFKESEEKDFGLDSGTGVFVGMDQRPSGLDINEKVSHKVANAVFDESGSDDDEECILDSTVKSNYDFSSGKSSPEHALLHKTNRHFEPDLSESFRSSPIYSKLIEPLPITFDDYDGSSPRSEKELETENTNPEVGTHNYRNPDWDSHATIGFIRSSKGSDDTFGSDKPMEENQNSFVGSVDEANESESPRPFSLPVESKDCSKINNETDSSSKGGMELNFGSLPGGRRNRTSWRPPYTKAGLANVSSPTSEAAINDGFGEREDSFPSYKFQGSPGRVDSEHGSTYYNAPRNYEPEIPHTRSNTAEPSDTGSIHENVPKTRAKDPTGYFEFDDGTKEEVPIPVMSKNVQAAGISRRTKGSKTRSGSSRLSSGQNNTTGTGQFSPMSYAAKAFSEETETENSSELGRNNDAPYVLRSETAPVSVEKPATSTSAEIPEAPSTENSGKKPSHVHPKLPDFETFTAHLQSLRTNRQ
ncbi:hypothetical protein RND81_06G188800 [Saponaria officinalis]|uniref:IST1-like protein n=1 Tax=Saponaria officinalis TaxID=3572 RepID=A0AAW1KC09_SAPOF